MMNPTTRATLVRKSFFIAWHALRRNRLQTILTMAGMTIGVATVLAMIAVGSGAQASIQDQVRAAGMNIVTITAGNYRAEQQWTSAGESEEPAGGPEPAAYRPECCGAVNLRRISQVETNPLVELSRRGEYAKGQGHSEKLTVDDGKAIKGLDGVLYVSPGVSDSGILKHGDVQWFTHVHGEGIELPLIRRAWTFANGRYFTESEIGSSSNVVVLGSVVKQKLFDDETAVGRSVTMRGATFRVVGVVSSASWMVPAAAGDDQFDAVYLPYTTAQRLFGKPSLTSITLSTASAGDVTRVDKEVASLLRKRHGIAYQQPDDFSIMTQAHMSLMRGGMRTDIARAISGNSGHLDKVTLAELSKTMEHASHTMTALLASIASVSLVVGGIGIMNIMLLSVTERTREIGIRRAVGARSYEVMLQFLMEAITLSFGGGALGVLCGVLGSAAISRMASWSTQISPSAVGLSFGVSAAVGILFGYYPAREASRVSPMTALRSE